MLAAVRARNPAVAAGQKRASAAHQRPRAEQPEDPMAMLEWWQQPVDFSTVPLMLTVKQPLPWRGRLGARREASEAEARALDADADGLGRRAEAEARRAYFDLALAERSLEVNQRQRALLATVVATTDGQYRVGKAVEAEVLRAQGELLATENDGLDLEREHDSAAARLDVLLDRPPSAPLPPVATAPGLRDLPSEAELIALALASRPAIRRAQAELEAARARAGLAQKENLPELAISTSFMVNVRGTDAFTVGISSTLPVFSTIRQRALGAAARLDVEAARRTLEATRRDTELGVHLALTSGAMAARHVRLHGEKLIPLAELTLQSTLASYQTGRVPFGAVLDAARMVRDHHLDHIKYLVAYEKSLADLAELGGLQ